MSGLINRKVLMRISDPWELGEAVNWEAFEARIIAVRGDKLLIQLLTPFIYRRVSCEFFIASPRHEGDHAENLLMGKSLFCGMTHITHEQANSDDPFDLKSWRGGIAVIGNLDSLFND